MAEAIDKPRSGSLQIKIEDSGWIKRLWLQILVLYRFLRILVWVQNSVFLEFTLALHNGAANVMLVVLVMVLVARVGCGCGCCRCCGCCCCCSSSFPSSAFEVAVLLLKLLKMPHWQSWRRGKSQQKPKANGSQKPKARKTKKHSPPYCIDSCTFLSLTLLSHSFWTSKNQMYSPKFRTNSFLISHSLWRLTAVNSIQGTS